MKLLFSSAIYVNASSERLLAASCGSNPSQPITEKKRWASGHKRFEEAARLGQKLPLIFAHYAPLTFWAVATDIEVSEASTTYRFSDLRPIQGYRRRDLIVESTGAPLPDNFIRSYSLVHTPNFLVTESRASVAESIPEELVGLEGEALQHMITHRYRETKLRDGKKAATLKAKGCLCCEVCGFDFSAIYGPLGDGFCEVHHLMPLSASSEAVTTTLDDLAILCSNCHRIIHRSVPILSVAELSNVVSLGRA